MLIYAIVAGLGVVVFALAVQLYMLRATVKTLNETIDNIMIAINALVEADRAMTGNMKTLVERLTRG